MPFFFKKKKTNKIIAYYIFKIYNFNVIKNVKIFRPSELFQEDSKFKSYYQLEMRSIFFVLNIEHKDLTWLGYNDGTASIAIYIFCKYITTFIRFIL